MSGAWALVPALAALLVAAEARAMEVAVSDDAAFVNQRRGEPGPWYGAARDLGASKLRIVVWGPEDLTRADKGVIGALKHGFEPQITLHWRNWHIRPRQDGFSTRKFLRFARDAVQRWPHVRRFSILNEPNFSYHPAKPTLETVGSRYRRLFRWSYAAIKATRRSAQVWAGETAPTRTWASDGFFAQFACLTGPKQPCRGMRADGWAHHPYQQDRPPGAFTEDGIGGCERQQRMILRAAKGKTFRTPKHGRVPLYLTEYGYQARPGKTYYGVPPSNDKAAQWWPQAMDVARSCGARQMLIYQLTELEDHYQWDTSLFRRDGSPRPAYRTLREWAKR